MPELPVSVLPLTALALIFDFLNGFPRQLEHRCHYDRLARAPAPALGVCHIVMGHETIGALVAAIVWNRMTWWLGIPPSSSHGLVGELIGPP